jgi:SAM-dependent methyltransferase
MRWLLKAGLQKTIGFLPEPDRWNYLLQTRISRSVPRPDGDLQWGLHQAIVHIDALRAIDASLDFAAAHWYEFGAGWDLLGPLSYYSFGVERQTLVDLRSNVRLEAVNDVLDRLGAHLDRLEHPAARRVDRRHLADLEELEPRFGIRYIAPCDARASGLPAGSVDIITSTHTLEHIPPGDIAAILGECARILREGGLMSSLIDMQDHYHWFDKSISVYNYLKFSDRVWSLVNSPVHYQNRLRHSDYMSLAKESDLEIVADDVQEPTVEDFDALAQVPLAERFRSYEKRDLAIRGVNLILRKGTADAGSDV